LASLKSTRPLLVHVTTTDMSLEWLLGPQLEAFAGSGFEVVGASGPGPFVEALRRRGVEHVALRHATRAMAPAQDARLFAELVALFRRRRPTIVHTHNPKPGWFGRPAAKVARVPVVVNTVHGLYAAPDDPAAKRAAVYTLERAAAACSDAELVQNPEDLAMLRRLRVPNRRLVLLGNGVDLARFGTAPAPAVVAAARAEMGAERDTDVVVGCVGRLVQEKGYTEVFEAAARLRERHPDVRVAVIGPDEPDKADSLGDRDRALAARAGVRLLGGRDDVVPYYAAMDVYVLASYREGFPRSAMEAAAMGVPIVATDIRGCRQVVDDGVTGTLVPPHDAAALAAAIESLAADPARRRAFSDAGRAKARREFDQDLCIERTLDTYRRCLVAKGIAPPAA
jgi:glycosyltransferase involved in cell wall biosynthesis